MQPKPLLKEKFELKLQIERNLDKSFSHRVPDLSVRGVLSKIHAVIDLKQYMMVKGLLGFNFGEPLDDLDFEDPLNEHQNNVAASAAGEKKVAGSIPGCLCTPE